MKMTRMNSATAPDAASTTPAIHWPEMNLPPSPSAIKGLTSEQHAAINDWYLGLKNTINNHNASVQKIIQQHAADIAALKTQIGGKKVAS